MLRDLASFLFFLSLLPFLFHGVQETSPDLRIWLLANLEEFFKFIISHCHSFLSSTFVVSFSFILLIFMSSCLAKLVFCGLYHFEEYSFARSGSNCGDSHRELSKLQPYFIAVGREGGRGEEYEDFVVSRQNLPDPPEGSLIFLGSPPSLVVNFTKIPLFVYNILLAATDLSFRSLRKIGDPTLSSEPLSPDENDD